MTREEQIKKQADIYTDNASNYTAWSDDGGWSVTDDIDFVEKAFIEGAKWADEHPKSPWISVKDKLPPKENCELSIKVLVVSTKNEIYFRRYDYDMKRWLCPIPGAEFTHWRLLPEPPKERR